MIFHVVRNEDHFICNALLSEYNIVLIELVQNDSFLSFQNKIHINCEITNKYIYKIQEFILCDLCLHFDAGTVCYKFQCVL